MNKYIWAVCGVALIISIIVTTVHINLIIGDIRDVASQMGIDDIRRIMDIIERQQELQLK